MLLYALTIVIFMKIHLGINRMGELQQVPKSRGALSSNTPGKATCKAELCSTAPEHQKLIRFQT